MGRGRRRQPHAKSVRAALWAAQHQVGLDEAARRHDVSRQAVRAAWSRWLPGVDPPRVKSVVSEELCASAVARVAAGAFVVDEAARIGVSVASLRLRMKTAGVTATRQGGVGGGRSRRALVRVLAGEGVLSACAAERCAHSWVYQLLKRHKTRPRA